MQFSSFVLALFFSVFLSLFATAAPVAEPAAELEERTSKSSKSKKVTYVGDATYYDVGLGACGEWNVSSDPIVAVSHTLFDTYPGYDGANPNNNPICGKKLTATYKGKSVTVTVRDRCVGCAPDDIDLSISAFEKLAPKAVGRMHDVKWSFN